MRLLTKLLIASGLMGLTRAIRLPRALGARAPGLQNDSCVCVKFFQCEEGQVITDGSGLIDVRFGPTKKCEGFDVCCHDEDVIKKVEATPGLDKNVMTTISDGIKDLFGRGDENRLYTGPQCACVPFYLCDGNVMAPETAQKIDQRQISSTGRCNSNNEKCCPMPKAPPAPVDLRCTCTGREYCNQKDIQIQVVGSIQPACGPSQVCCKSPLLQPVGGTTAPPVGGGTGVVVQPEQQRPDYDIWKFCKAYPMSVACVHSRKLSGRPTLREDPAFNPKNDAQRLKSAIGYFDADDDVLIDILTKRTFAQRAVISQVYERDYGENLLHKVERTTRGNFEDLMIALLRAPDYYSFLAQSIHDGMDRLGTDEDAVLQPLISSTNDEIELIKPLYYAIEGDTLIDDIKSDFSGHLEDLLVALVNNSRDNTFVVSKQRARDQANLLYQAGSGGTGIGTDETTFKYYLTHENYPQLALIFSEYEQMAGESFTEALEDEFSRYMEDAVLAIAEVTRSLPRYLATRLHHALWGRIITKDDSSLIRIIVSRAEIDLGNIKDEYKIKYGRELTTDIELKAQGDYEDALLALCGGKDSSSFY